MSAAPIPWKHVRNVLVLFAPVWVGTTVLFAFAGVGIVLLSSDRWAARQPLVLRDEATGAVDRLGRFGSQTEMKAAQETILEMARNPEVVAAALRQIGPPSGGNDSSWPSTKVIDTVSRENVNVIAPQGSEFGNSELVYLKAIAETPERAEAFCVAMLDNLTSHLRTVRRLRADSVIVELTYARDLARQKLDSAIAKLREVEVGIGEDLGELRNLNDTISGDGANRRTIEVISQELQVAELELERLESLHTLLVMGAEDPKQLLISGDELLSSQPTLQRLKEGLIDAQLESSRLVGVYTDEHPRRRSAQKTETEILQRMLTESRSAIRAMEPMLQLARGRVDRLQTKRVELNRKLELLAGMRTDYSKIDSEVDALTEQLSLAEGKLSEAQASRSAALATNLLAELGPPQLGDAPEGTSGSIMAAGSTMAGLMFGLGAVFLIAPGPSGTSCGRRWSDRLTGRRSSDQAGGSRVPATPPPGGIDRRAPRER